MNCEPSDVQAGFRKGRGNRNQIANIHWIMEKAREFQKKTSISAFLTMPNVDHKLWKILQEMGIPDHLTCLLRKLYAGHEATVRTEHGTTDLFQIGKGVRQSCLYIVTLLIELLCSIHHEKCWTGRNTSWNQDCWEKSQSPQICRWHHPYGRKWRGTKEPLEESERGEWKSWLKLNIQKMKIMASGRITSWQLDSETVETVADYYRGLQNHCKWWMRSWS